MSERMNSWHRSTLVALMAMLGACGGESNPSNEPPAETLRRRFPAHASKVLDTQGRFASTEHGFTLAGDPALDVRLPRDAHEAVVLRSGDDFEVRVRETGLEGEGAIAERAVAYKRAGGTSFWTAAVNGVEEWLHFEAGSARTGHSVAAWEIDGARVQQRDEAVELIDTDGLVRMRVTAPEAYTAAGRLVTARLDVRGSSIELSVDADGEEVLVDPSWAQAGTLSIVRNDHASTLLADGSVLVVGGSNGSSLLTAERYDPATNVWTLTTGNMFVGRRLHTATKLDDDSVLVAGGISTAILSTAELYDPVTQMWSATGTMKATRDYHTATLLKTGKVLVVGGYAGGTTLLNTSELYDPFAKTWALTGQLLDNRFDHTATRLTDGRVMIIGGSSISSPVNYLQTAEIYDPMTETWTPAAPMVEGRRFHATSLLPNGDVLVAGGYNPTGRLRSTERYNPATNTWTSAGNMNVPRRYHTATLLDNGLVLVAGGENGSTHQTTELYNPVTNTWSGGPLMQQATHQQHTAVKLLSGNVLVIAGLSAKTAERLRADAGTACLAALDCVSGVCADGVCCNVVCNGACLACSVAAGAAVDGTCGPVMCPAIDGCHDAGTCDSATGMCSTPIKADGAGCDDGDLCTLMDTCQSGVCAAGAPVTCVAADNCHDAGTCDSATGMCSNPNKSDGSMCSDGNACTQTDACQSGVCTGGNPVVCAPPEACKEAGTCDPASGMCTYPNKSDGSTCDDGDACTSGDACQAGACKPGMPKQCPAPDDCHEASTCAPSTGDCPLVAKADDVPCSGGTCQSGTCVPSVSSSSSSGGMTTSTTSSAGAGGADGDGETVSTNFYGCTMPAGPSRAPRPTLAALVIGMLLSARRRAGRRSSN